MAKIDDVVDRVNAVAQRVGVIEATLKEHNRLTAWIPAAAGAAALAALAWCYHLGLKVAVIESGGNTKLVTELKNPRSPEQLQANLSTVVAQVQTAQANGKTPDPKKTQALSGAVTTVVDRDPQLPEVWQAAAALISLRQANLPLVVIPPDVRALSGDPTPNKGDCYNLHMNSYGDTGKESPGEIALHPITLHDCTIKIDDLSGFEQSTFMRNIAGISAPGSQNFLMMTLVRVQIIYRGGRLIPISRLTMYGCTFNFNVPVTPPQRGKFLISSLLAEDLSAPVQTVKFPPEQPV